MAQLPAAERTTTTPATPNLAPDWTVQAADTIESVVDSIKSKTAVPLQTVARGLVYGIVAGVMGLAILVLVTVALVRVLVIAYDEVGAGVWAAHLTLGGLFTLLGLFFWSKRKPKES